MATPDLDICTGMRLTLGSSFDLLLVA